MQWQNGLATTFHPETGAIMVRETSSFDHHSEPNPKRRTQDQYDVQGQNQRQRLASSSGAPLAIRWIAAQG